ncbi:hypothetical protein KFE25_002262 [Diacronema lutheri]|uniref:Uncharacterized protein n=1 Tax=Diacronema lutheri TaxID=2081491 RepID=A0A8J5X2U5_DIALT|nr:hypothetical protein KFE25_002262 [Diacronema lutheri]
MIACGGHRLVRQPPCRPKTKKRHCAKQPLRTRRGSSSSTPHARSRNPCEPHLPAHTSPARLRGPTVVLGSSF